MIMHDVRGKVVVYAQCMIHVFVGVSRVAFVGSARPMHSQARIYQCAFAFHTKHFPRGRGTMQGTVCICYS